MRSFAATRDPAVFAGQPRLLVPHPDLGAVLAVLDEPEMRGRLPPSAAPGVPLGRVSLAVRGVLAVAGWLFPAAAAGMLAALAFSRFRPAPASAKTSAA